jgi:integrase
MKQITIANCCIYPEEWDNELKELIIPSFLDRDLFERREFLLKLKEQMDSELDFVRSQISLIESKGLFRLENLPAILRYVKHKENLGDYVLSLCKGLRQQNRDGLAIAYQTATQRLIRFNSGKDISLKHINAYLMENFEFALRSEGKQPNTISFYMRNLRAIYNRAVEQMLIEPQKVNPFGRVFMGVDKTSKRALTVNELRKLYGLSFTPQQKSLQEAFLYFFFSFYACGMSFIDLVFLRKVNIRNGIIRYYRRKTRQPIEMKVTKEMHAIINHFAPQCQTSDFVFPIIQNDGTDYRLQYTNALRLQNLHLKKLGEMAGIKQTLSAHVSRHTWASLGKHLHLPLTVLQECMGHSSLKTTSIYLQSFDTEILHRANRRIADMLTKQPKNINRRK